MPPHAHAGVTAGATAGHQRCHHHSPSPKLGQPLMAAQSFQRFQNTMPQVSFFLSAATSPPGDAAGAPPSHQVVGNVTASPIQAPFFFLPPLSSPSSAGPVTGSPCGPHFLPLFMAAAMSTITRDQAVAAPPCSLMTVQQQGKSLCHFYLAGARLTPPAKDRAICSAPLHSPCAASSQAAAISSHCVSGVVVRKRSSRWEAKQITLRDFKNLKKKITMEICFVSGIFEGTEGMEETNAEQTRIPFL